MSWIEALTHQLRYAASEARQILADLKDCARAFRDGFTGKWDR